MSLLRMYMCDGCGGRSEMVVRVPEGWLALRFTPGMLQNTRPRPDRHFCPGSCSEKARTDERVRLEDE